MCIRDRIKLRIPATAALASRLAAEGFREVLPAQPEQSVLWDREGALRTQGSALRTRRYAGGTRLTWKGPKVPDALLKIRPELETAVESGEALEAILRALGFEPILRMEKVRAVWEGAGLEVCLDEAPFGCFVELEGEAAAIHAALASLGLSPASAETRSYPELYVAHGLGGAAPEVR